VRGIFLCHELLSAGTVPVACLANALEPLVRLERREAFEIAAQIVRKYECAASAFHCTERARTNRLIKRRSTGTCDGARLGDAVGKWCSHESSFSALGRDGPGDRARVHRGTRARITNSGSLKRWAIPCLTKLFARKLS
jgi:hypothetical protein